MKLSGTSVVKLSNFIENLKELAGTTTITRTDYDYNNKKICSYSHVNKLFNLTWNECLKLAGLSVNRNLPFPSKQGRKVKIKDVGKEMECLYCLNNFISYSKFNRICKNCVEIVNNQEDL